MIQLFSELILSIFIKNLREISLGGIIQIVFALISLFIILGKFIFRFWFFEETISLKISGFEKLTINFADFTIFFFKIFQIIIFSIQNENALTIYFILISGILI